MRSTSAGLVSYLESYRFCSMLTSSTFILKSKFKVILSFSMKMSIDSDLPVRTKEAELKN